MYPPPSFTIDPDATPFNRRIHEHPPGNPFKFKVDELIQDVLTFGNDDDDPDDPVYTIMIDVFCLLLVMPNRWNDLNEGDDWKGARLVALANIRDPRFRCASCRQNGNTRCYRVKTGLLRVSSSTSSPSQAD